MRVMDKLSAAYQPQHHARGIHARRLSTAHSATQPDEWSDPAQEAESLSINFDSRRSRSLRLICALGLPPERTPAQFMLMPAKEAVPARSILPERFLDSPRTRFNHVTPQATATLAADPRMRSTLVPKRANPNFTSAKVWIRRCRLQYQTFDNRTRTD